MQNGIQTPGFISLPLCTQGRLQQAATQYLKYKMHTISSEEYIPLPCGEGALYDSDKAAWSF
jgi:hypothetical protein